MEPKNSVLEGGMLDRQVELVEDGERMIERGTMCGEPFERELMEWQKIDRRLRSYHAKRSALDAAEAFDLVRAEELKLHFSFGCATFLEYMGAPGKPGRGGRMS